MSITFNNFENATSVIYYAAGGGSTNRYVSNSWASGDAFPDSFSAGDYILANVDSASTLEKAILILNATRT